MKKQEAIKETGAVALPLEDETLTFEQEARGHRLFEYIVPLINRVKQRPLFQKVIIANTLLIAIGTSVGTFLEKRYFEGEEALPLVLFITGGIWLSIITNYLIVKRAFRPLDDVTDRVESIRRGNRRVRVPEITDDPQLGKLSRSLNAMLNSMERQRQQGAAAVIHAQEEERKRIARELHDETSQSLTGLVVGIQVVEELLQDAQPEASERLQSIKDLAHTTLNEVHTMAVRLRPSVLDDLGLPSALRSYVKDFSENTGIDVDLQVPTRSRRLHPELETVLYRVVQEALTNVARHSGADSCTVKLEQRQDRLHGTIIDNGQGFDPQPLMTSSHRGLGLHGMKERIELVQGSINIHSGPGGGSTVHLEVPLDSGEAIP